jgi:hypothetical protein
MRKNIDKRPAVGHDTKTIERLVGFRDDRANVGNRLPATLVKLQRVVMKSFRLQQAAIYTATG